MNNLTLSSLVFATGAAVWLGRHSSLEHSRGDARALTQDVNAAQTALDTTTHATAETQASLAARRDESKSAQAEYEAVVTAARHEFPAPPMDPAGEGAWPAERPYFYLAKKHLSKIGYLGFSKDHHLSEPATVLFGLTPTEKAAVDAACNSLYERVGQLQQTHAERLEPKPGVNTDTHREISYRVPTMTNELNEARSGMASSIRDAIGEERARYLLEHVHGDFELPVSTMTDHAENAIVTLEADRMRDGGVRHRLKIVTPGTGSMFVPVYFPLTSDSELWTYRHLFGDQPLIPLPTAAQQDK